MFPVERQREIELTEMVIESARVGVQEMSVLRRTSFADLQAAVERLLLDPDNVRARSAVARQAGVLSRIEVAVAELSAARSINARRLERLAG
jgi:hypothetical protein